MQEKWAPVCDLGVHKQEIRKAEKGVLGKNQTLTVKVREALPALKKIGTEF